MGVGKQLKGVRKELEMSLDEVEECTKIRKKYIEDIEKERFDRIPGDAYVRAFLKNYAECLDLDSKEVIQLYKEQKSEENNPEGNNAQNTSSKKQYKRWAEIKFVLKKVSPYLLIILFFAGFYLVYHYGYFEKFIEFFSEKI